MSYFVVLRSLFPFSSSFLLEEFNLSLWVLLLLLLSLARLQEHIFSSSSLSLSLANFKLLRVQNHDTFPLLLSSQDSLQAIRLFPLHIAILSFLPPPPSFFFLAKIALLRRRGAEKEEEEIDCSFD